jgi:hypothetical protein
VVCEPAALSGEEVAARAGQRNPYASRAPLVTGSLGGSKAAPPRHKFSGKVNEEDEFEGMIRKSGNRFSEKIMLKQKDEIMIRFNLIGS